MKYYEIRNRTTQETAQTTAPNYATACKQVGWKPQECKCIWHTDADNAPDQADY